MANEPQIETFEIPGPLLITPRAFRDDRGVFVERFRVDQWHQLFPEHAGFIQDNYSWSRPGVLRGMHFQFGPDQGKLVTCMQGAILDVIVDIRDHSLTLGHHLKVELKAETPKWLWVPVGFAHSFVVTSSDGAGVMYKVDAPWNPAGEGAIRWNDPALKIDWPLRDPIVSAKDAAAPTLEEYLRARK